MSLPSKKSAAPQWFTINERHETQRLDNYLLATLKGVPRTHVYRVIRTGEVRVNSARAKPGTRLKAGDRVRVPPIVTAERPPIRPEQLEGRNLESRVLYEDPHLLVLDKPAGLAVHAGSGVAAGLIEIIRAQRAEERFLELAHRLDRDTSGCLLLAKKRLILKELNELFKVNSNKNKVLIKHYQALVMGDWRAAETVSKPLRRYSRKGGERVVVVDSDGKFARSRFIPRHRYPGATLVQVKLFTGRTHQVRVHAQSAGHPVAGDEKYGDRLFNRRLKALGLKRLFLHASELRFDHPATGRRVEVRSPLPGELGRVLDALRKEADS